MAKKRSGEHPKIMLVRTLPGFAAAHPYAEEQLTAFPIGAVVEATIYMERSHKRLGLYWCVLKECVDNSENKYGSSQDLHDALKIALGYRREVKMLGVGTGAVILKKLDAVIKRVGDFVERCLPLVPDRWHEPARGLVTEAKGHIDHLYQHIGETLIFPGSIAFDKMDEAEFKIFLDRAFNELRRAGYPVDAYIDKGKKKMSLLKSPYRAPGEQHGRGQAPPRGDRPTQGQGTEGKEAA